MSIDVNLDLKKSQNLLKKNISSAAICCHKKKKRTKLKIKIYLKSGLKFLKN